MSYNDIFVTLLMVPKGDELPIKVPLTGDSGLARVRGHVKSSV